MKRWRPAAYPRPTMSWNEQAGSVSRAFDDWTLADRDIRAFLKVDARFAQSEYDRIERELMNSPGDPEGPELPDLFHDAVEGLWPSDHEWMLLSSVVKDGVTAFEVYLEKAANEVRKVHGLGDLEGKRGFLNWNDLRDFYKEHLGLSIDTAEVTRIRKLRHLLTHSRGELRTEADRNAFGDQTEIFPSRQAKLSQGEVMAMLDELGEAVRRVDPTVWRFAWTGDRAPSLLALQGQAGP
jgi:hypothetical protein